MEDKSSIWGCLGIVGFIIVVGLLFSIKVVSPTEKAVAVRFGHVAGVRGNGIRIDPLANYEKYDTKLQVHSTTQAAATSDLQDINVDITVNYSLKPDKIEDIYREIGTMENVTVKVLDPLVAQSLKSIATQYGGEELIQKREEVSKAIQEQLTADLGDSYHINVHAVSLTNMTFMNAQFNEAIDKKQIAEQDALRASFELETSKVEAEKQRVQQSTLTAQILQKMWIEKWNGQLPSSLYITDEQSQFLLPAK